jgi:hypothetical protein
MAVHSGHPPKKACALLDLLGDGVELNSAPLRRHVHARTSGTFDLLSVVSSILEK